MKGLRSSQTNTILKWIAHFSAALFVAWSLGSCTLIRDQQEPLPEPIVKPDRPEPALPCSTLPTKELEREALELIDAGKAPEAREKLACALELSPGSKQASLLLEQLDADPLEYLGNEYFWHQVKSSETLSKIAKQYLGSSLKFVILARYNGIDVPANLVAGQDIKIPGTKPVADMSPEPEVAPEALVEDAATLRDQALEREQQGKLNEAFELITRAQAEDPDLANTADDLARISKQLVLQLEEDAYNQELSGDPEKAVEIWRRILSIDPGNIPAQLALKRLTE